MKKSTKIIILAILSLAWMACIFKLSSMTSYNSNGKSIDIISIFIEDTLNITNSYGITSSYPSNDKIAHASALLNPILRKVIHATVYFVLAFFIMILINIIFDYKHYILGFIITLLICIIFASSDEIHQLFVAGRTGQLVDVVIDSIGALIGILFYSTYYLVYKNGYKRGIKEITATDKWYQFF